MGGPGSGPHKGVKRGPRPQTLRILELRRQGYMYKEIMDIVGCCKDTIKDAVRNYGEKKQAHIGESDAREVVNASGFDYVGGFTNTKGTVILRCRECGHEFTRYYDAVRNEVHGKRKEKLTCPACFQKKWKQYREQKNAPKQRDAQERAERAAENRSRKISDQLTRRLAIHVCKNCGTEFCMEATGYNSEQYCSKKCQSRYFNRAKNEKRIDRLKSRMHDTDITLEKLFKRDGGVCYICGKTCDWSDIVEKDGTMVAGDSYPSIDHVKPVARGGTHTWDNIKLACRICNTLKGWR